MKSSPMRTAATGPAAAVASLAAADDPLLMHFLMQQQQQQQQQQQVDDSEMLFAEEMKYHRSPNARAPEAGPGARSGMVAQRSYGGGGREEYGQDDDDQYDDYGDEEGDMAGLASAYRAGDEEGEGADTAPKMSEDYYQSVESFLKRPPPKFGGGYPEPPGAPSVGGGGGGGAVAAAATGGGGGKRPPKVRAPQGFSSEMPPALPPASKTTSKIKDIIKTRKPKDLDMNLLQQAFEYTEKLAHINLDDDNDGAAIALGRDGDQADNGSYKSRNFGGEGPHPRSAPPQPKKKTGKKGSGGGGGGGGGAPYKPQGKGGGLVRKLRAQTDGPSGPGASGFDLSSQEGDSKRNVLDFDALVNNFQTGEGLMRLRAELEASQQAMHRSAEVMRKITQEALSGM